MHDLMYVIYARLNVRYVYGLCVCNARYVCTLLCTVCMYARLNVRHVCTLLCTVCMYARLNVRYVCTHVYTPHKTLRICRNEKIQKLRLNGKMLLKKQICRLITFVKLYLLRSLFVDLIYTFRTFLNE